MQLQPISYEDLEEITEIARRTLVYDKITREVIAEKIFDEPRYRPEHAMKAILHERIAAFMVGHVSVRNGRKVAWIKFFATRPEFRRLGAAKTLLADLEQKFRAEAVEQIRTLDCPPNYLSAGIDPRYTEAVALFTRRGYRREDENFDMICSLDRNFSTQDEEDRLRSMGLTVGRLADEDRPSLFELVRTHWPGWLYECERAIENSPCSVHVALDGKRIVAFSAYEGNNRGTGWFGPMGTDPEYRGKRIGEVLLKRCLADLRGLGHSQAIIPWVGPLYFYLNTVGARVSRVLWVYVRDI